MNKRNNVVAPETSSSRSFVLKGDIVHSIDSTHTQAAPNSYLVCDKGISRGIFEQLSSAYDTLPLYDYSGHLITPGFIDLHTHAPQYPFRAQGMDLELLDWLHDYTFPEESRYCDLDYARRAYTVFVDRLKESVTTRALVFATIHLPATLELMELLESSGLMSYVGKVNMDRNAIPKLEETNAEESLEQTQLWLERVSTRGFERTRAIITPRFIPSCSPELLDGLRALQQEHRVPVQSHLSENLSEIQWVKELCPESASYADAYRCVGLLGGEDVPTVMAHCVYLDASERALLKEQGVWVAHCPESNTCLSSGIAPMRAYLTQGLRVGLGTDIAGGYSLSMLHSSAEAIKVSKLYWRLVDESAQPLTVPEAFYLATRGGGSFWGKVGSFEPGYEFDALVFDECQDPTLTPPDINGRLERLIYLDTQHKLLAKYVAGAKIALEKR